MRDRISGSQSAMKDPGSRVVNARSRKVSAMSPLGSATVLAAAVLYDCAACLDLPYLTGTVPSSSRDGQFQRSRSGLRVTNWNYLSYGGGQSSGNVELWCNVVFIMITIFNI